MHSMLVSFVTQLCQGCQAWRMGTPIDFDMIFHFESLSLQSLAQCWEAFAWTLNGFGERMVFIIGGVDQCTDDVSWFFESLRDREKKYREDPIEVIFTSEGDSVHLDSYQGYPTISVDQFMMEQEKHYEDVGSGELSESLAKLARRHHFSSETRIKMDTSIRACGHDIQRGQMVLEWVSMRRQQLASEDEILEGLDSLLTGSLLSLFRSLQDLYPEYLQDFIRDAIGLVQHALHPLKLIELASALSVSDRLQDKHESDLGLTLKRLDQIIPGLLVVRFGEVFLSHDQLTTKLDDETNAASHHAAITRRCLNYLKLTETEQAARRMVDQLPYRTIALFPERNGWASYCVRNLVSHYKLAGTDAPCNEMRSFFDARKTREVWSQAYYALSHCCMTLHQSYMSPLPVLARAGLHDLLVQMTDHSQRFDSTNFPADCSLATVEAARRGDMATVRFLMDKSMPEARAMHDIMKAAAGNGDGSLLEYLLDRARPLPGLKPPPQVLFCAAYSGFELVLKLVFEYDPDAQQKLVEECEISALNAAIRARQYEACKILLEHGNIGK